MARTLNKGFTLIEVLVAVTLMSTLVIISASYLNFTTAIVASQSTRLLAAFTEIETDFNRYFSEKNATPTGLTDSTFVPVYLFVPVAPDGFDITYGVTGFTLTQITGQTSPNNGWVICSKIAVTGSTDTNYSAVKKVATQVSAQKYFYNTSCGATSNMADPSGAATVYPNYWILRQ